MNPVSATPAPPARYRFAAVTLDASARRLEVDGEARHLEPKAFDLLLLLIEARQRAVSKDELLDRIWPGRVVVEGALKRSIGLIRQALDDDPKAPRFIRTVHGVGYQFVGEVEPLGAEPPQPGAPIRARNLRAPLGWTAALAVALLLTVLAFANLWQDAGGVEEGAVRAMILPFENATGDRQLDWVERGLPGLAAHALVEEPGLSLMAAETGERLAQAAGIGFDAGTTELAALRELLGADFLVLGRVAGAPRAWQLHLRILDAGGRISEQRLDAGELATLATDHGYRELRLSLLGGLRAPAAARNLSFDPYINESYARALAARAEGDSARARDLLAVVVRAAPDDMHLRMDLAEVEYRLGERERMPELLAPVADAVAQDPLSALALRLNTQLGSMADDSGDRAGARGHFADVLELAVLRGDRIAEADALRLLGRLASHEDDWEAAERQLGRALTVFTQAGYEPGRAMTLSHLAQVHWRQGNALESKRHYELALASFERQGRRDGAASMQGNLGNIDFELGDVEGALDRYHAALATQRELGNRSSELHALRNLLRALSALGRHREARAYADEMRVAAEALGDLRFVANARMALAGVASALEQVDEAVAWYDAAGEAFEAAGMRDYAQTARSRQVWELADAGRVDEARAQYELHHELLQEASSPYLQSQVLGAEAALAQAEGRLDDAVASLSAGRELTQSAGLSFNANWFTARLALTLLQAGRLDEAEVWVGRVEDFDGSFADAFEVRARHAYERGDYAAAVAHKERMREVAGQGWRERHDAQLSTYHEALAGGRRPPLDDEI
jgi:DNA-binding winged helix-turn-helix (wHTH) protein